MIYVTNVSKSFGGKPLFDGVNLTIKSKDKIGLVGRNGAGKSTFLKLLMGQIGVDSGEITIPKETTLGYLPQDLDFKSDKTVVEETKAAFAEIQKLEKEFEKIQHELTVREDYESEAYLNLINRMNEIQDRQHRLGGFEAEEKVERILKGLGFTQADLDRRVDEFSGGWQMRIVLAKILLKKPDLMLLDEPTNHLDIESIIWLEGFLKDYEGAIIMISHDRTFLDNITTRTVELILGKAEDYKAPYTKYMELREERRLAQESAKKNQDRQVAQMERNIEKFRAKANKAKFAQSLIKKLDKLDRIEIDETDVKSFKMTFPPTPPSGKVVLEVKDLRKSYGDMEVIKGESFYVNKGDRIAFIGKNGMGKTTLSRIIVGDLDYKGQMKLGHNVKVGFYAQHQADQLQNDTTIFDFIDEAATGEMRTKVRSLLGSFLFSGEDQLKKVKVLSGGEKSRVALAKMLLDPVNLLVMDEPTNHLDMLSKDKLKEALLSYDGTLLIVSHDRDFLQGLTNRLFEFTPTGIKEHLGNVKEFLSMKDAETFREIEISKSTHATSATKKEKKESDHKESYANKKENEKELRKLKNKVSNSEKKINDLEKEIGEIELKLRDPEFFQSVADDQNFFLKYEDLKKQLESEMEVWEKWSEKLDKVG